MKFPPSSQNRSNRTAIFWAVVSQSIWLPVFLSNSQENFYATNKANDSTSNNKTSERELNNGLFISSENTSAFVRGDGHARVSGEAHNTGIVLNSALNNQPSLSGETSRTLIATPSFNAALVARSSPDPDDSGGIPNQIINQQSRTLSSARVSNTSRATFIQRLYSRSELLGGTLTLQDLAEPSMPAMARAERAQWSRSGDPLASLPPMWREPMRRALHSLSYQRESAPGEKSGRGDSTVSLDPARLVHVPSTKIRRASQVALALQSDGSVDILNQPDDPAIIEEINRWSTKQQLPAKGKIRPAVVHLHPMDPSDIGRSNNMNVSINPSQLSPATVAVPPAPSPEPKITSEPASAPAPASASAVNPLPAVYQPAATAEPPPPAPATSAIPQPASTPGPAATSEADT